MKLACEIELNGDKEDEIVAIKDKCTLLESKLSTVYREFHPKSWKNDQNRNQQNLLNWKYRDVVDNYDDWARCHRKGMYAILTSLALVLKRL